MFFVQEFGRCGRGVNGAILDSSGSRGTTLDKSKSILSDIGSSSSAHSAMDHSWSL